MNIEDLKHKINGLFLNEHIDKYALKTLTDILDSTKISCLYACNSVVNNYENDGMENMNIRDKSNYEVCKNALSNNCL